MAGVPDRPIGQFKEFQANVAEMKPVAERAGLGGRFEGLCRLDGSRGVVSTKNVARLGGPGLPGTLTSSRKCRSRNTKFYPENCPDTNELEARFPGGKAPESA